MHEADVNRRQRLFGKGREDLLLEDDSILGWDIAVRVFNRLATNDLREFKSFLVGHHVQCNRAISRVVRHRSFNNKGIAFFSSWEFDVLQLHVVKCHSFGSRDILFVHNLDTHVIEKVSIGTSEVQVKGSILSRDFEVVLGEEMVPALLKWKVIQSVLFSLVS